MQQSEFAQMSGTDIENRCLKVWRPLNPPSPKLPKTMIVSAVKCHQHILRLPQYNIMFSSHKSWIHPYTFMGPA